MANEWSQELLDELNRAGQEFESAALSGDPRIPTSVQQKVAENVFYRYYQQQQAERKANRGRTANSYLRQSVANNVANPVEYSNEELTAARNRVAELQEQVDRLTAANNSRYVSEAYKSQNKAELENKQSALALAQQQQERMERDTARARQATQRKVVDEAAERGVSYKDQSEAYGQSLKEMYEQREQLRQQLNGLDKKYSRANSDLDFETRKRMYDEEKESTTDRLEKLEREIERIEGQQNYASLNFGKDKNAAVVIKQGEELARTLKDQYLAGNIPDPTSNADYRAWAENNTDKTAKDYAEQQYADREPNDLWTQDEKNRYFTLMTINPESAFQYAVEINSAINREVNERAASDFSNLFPDYDMSKEAREGRSGITNALMWAGNAASDVAGIAGGVATGPVKLFNWLDNIYQNNERGGYYAGNNTPRISDYTDKLLSQNAERLNSYGTISNDKPILGGKGLGDLYQLVESVAQSMAYGAGLSKVFGVGATTAAGIQAAQKAAKLSTSLIFFGQAADSSYNEYIQRGMSREQATVGSFFAGLAEAAGEEFSIDHLISGDIAEGLAKYAAKQSFIESTEEGFTDILNLFGDELAARLTGGKSKMRQDIEALKSRGMSDERAKRQVWKQFVDDTIFDMFGGAFSGGLSAGIFGGMNKLWEMRKDSVLGKQSGTHVAGKDGKATGTKASNATDAQLEKLLVQAEKRGDLQTALFIANELINREEAGQRQRPTGDPNSTSMLAERILDGMRRKAGVIQDSDGLGETPLNDDELPPPYEEERPPMPGDEEAPPEWANRPQQEPTAGEQRNGNEPPARSDREAPPAWRSGNTDLGSAQQKSSLELEFDEQLNEMRQRAIGSNQTSRDNRASLKVEVNSDVFDKYYSISGFNPEKYCDDFAAEHPGLTPQSTGRDENALVDYLKKEELRRLDEARQSESYKANINGYVELTEKSAEKEIAFLDAIKKSLSEERNTNASSFSSTERRNAAILAAYLQSLAKKIYDAKNAYNHSKTDANLEVYKSWQRAYAEALLQYRWYWRGLQNAAGQQEAPAGQITQPSQQNAAQTVKPNDSATAENKLFNVTQNPNGVSARSTVKPDSVGQQAEQRKTLPENHYPFYGDEADSALKSLLPDEFAKAKEVREGQPAEFNIDGVHISVSLDDGEYGYSSFAKGKYIPEAGWWTADYHDAGLESSAEDALLAALKNAFRINNNEINLSPLIASAESGTMSVPNTQEVTTNAGEQAVRTDEAAAGESDAGRPVREAGERTSDGLLGSQRTYEEGVSGQQSRESEADEGTPSFVTEQDLKTLPSENEVRPLTPQQKSSFKDALKDTNDGTEAVTRPKLGSRLHFVQNFLTKIGVDQDVLFATNRSGAVFKDGRKGTHNSGKAIISADIDGLDLLPTAIHEVSHKKFFEKFGGMAAKDVINGSYKRRMSVFTKAFMDAFDPMKALNIMNEAQNLVTKDYAYEKKYAKERGGRVSAISKELSRTGRYLGTDAKALVQEMEKARSLEEFANELIAWDDVFLEAVNDKLGLSYEEIANLRGKLLSALEGEGAVTKEYITAINDAVQEWQDLDGEFTDDELEFPDFGLSGDLFGDIADSDASNFGNNEERRKELGAALRALISGDTEAIQRLSDDTLNYAINYTLKQADPDLDFKEKRRSYNVIANILSGENLSRSGLRRDADSNLISPQFGTADSIMQKGGGRRNQLYDFVSAGKLRDVHSDEYVSREHVSNEGKEFGRYQTISTDEERATNRERAVLINAINELDRRGLNIWGNEQAQGESGTTDDFEKKEKTWWEEPEFSETDRYDQLAGDYADEVDEDIGRYEKTQATKDLKRMREGDNWLQGTVKVDPEVKEWGRGAKKTAGQKTQGWYDINRRSSLAEREFARQRVMNARAAEDLSFEIQTMEDQAADIREEVERARRNSPAAKESLKMIDGLLEDLNSDIDDLYAIDDMFRDAVREDPNSDMTKQLAAEGTRLASEIESLRRDIDTLGRLANESIGNNNSEELRDAEKRLKKQEQKIKTKREHLQELLDKSRGGNTSGALVASRAETAFDSMPDDVIKQIIRNGYVSMDMLQDYYGNADAAYQTMYEFQERVGDTNKTRVPSVHKLTSLEKTALHGILAERKNNSKITSGYGGVEMYEDLPERSPSAPASMSKAEYTEAMQQEYGPYISDEQRKKSKSKSANDKRIPATVQPITNEAISERNRRAYQSSKFNGGMVLEPTGPTPANMDRLNRMFADRLGIENKGTTAGAIGTPKSFYDSDASDFGTNKGQKKKPLIVDAAYTNYAAAAQSVADLHKKIMSDIMAENPNAEPDFIDKQIEDSFLGNSVRALDTAVSQIANSKDPLGAVFNLRQQLYSAKNKGEGTYAALTSDAVIGMCDEIGRLIENKTMPYDEKARAYAVATTQLVSALSTRAERLYDAAHRVQRIQDKLATVTKKDRGKLREALTGYKIMQMNPTTLFKMLDNFDVGGKGAGYEIARALENGTVKSAELIARAARQFDEAKETEGFQEFAEGKTNAKYKFKGEYTISELQAIEFILLARRMNGMKVYDVDAHGGVIEKTRLQTLKGFALRDADGNHIFVDSMYEASPGKKKRFDWYKEAESMYRNLSPAAKAYLKAVNKVMDGLGKEIRQAKINATGVGFTGMEGTGYYPISYISDKEHLPDYNTKPDYEGLSHDRHLESPRLTHGGYAVVQNAAQRVDRYVEWASNYAGFADIADMLQTMNVSGNGRGIVNATADAYGVKYAKAIERYIGDVNNFTDVSRESTENSTIRALRQNMAAGVLGLSLSVPIKQVASYWDAAGILSMDSLRRAYRVKAFVKEKGLGADNMFLKSREVGNVDPTVSEMMGSGLMDNLKKRSGIVKLLAEATNRMDYKTVDNLFTATVLDVEANLPGIDKNSELFKRAVEAKFNQVVLNTQPIFNKNARSEYQRSSNEWQRMFAMFRTQQTQNFNRLIVTTMEARAAKGTSLETATKRQLRQTIAGQVAGQLEFAALTALANFVMHGWKRWRDDDDEITVESVAKRFGLDTLESIAGTAWFGDEIAKMLIDGAFGTNESFGVSMGVLSSVVDTAKYLFDIIGDVAKGNPLDIFDSTRKFVGAGASVLGLPVNNLYRLANAAVMWGADALKWASKGKYGNRANYDDSMKMLDAWIKGGLKEEGAKKQAAKAFRKDQPENLLYNLGILSSLTSKDSKVDKGTDWLNTRIQGKTEAERKAYKEDELARLGRNLNAGERIANYLADSALSAAQKDEAISKFATTSGYNVLYESLRAAGMTPKAAVEELGKTDNKTGLSTDIRSDDSLADLYAGKDNPGETNDVPALDKKNTDEYVNFVSAMKVFRDTGNYSQLDKLVDQYSKLDANTRAVIDAKDSAIGKYREYRSMGLSTKDYYNVKDAIKQAQIDLDLAANTGTAVKLVGLSKANLTKAQIQKLVNSEALGISKTGKSLISVLGKYGYTVGDIGMFMYNTDWTNDDSNGTLSQQEVVLALAKEKRLTDAQRSAIYEELKPLLRNEYKINHWYDKSYEYELNYLLQNGKTSGRAS